MIADIAQHFGFNPDVCMDADGYAREVPQRIAIVRGRRVMPSPENAALFAVIARHLATLPKKQFFPVQQVHVGQGGE